MSTLVLPASGLPGHAELRGDLRPADALVDGRNAAASTARRNRTILANAMDYAIELDLLDSNPIRALKWTAPKVSSHVDWRSVVNPRQARALLAAVREQQPSGPSLVAFFAVIYYAGLRPEEAISLRAERTSSYRPKLKTHKMIRPGESCTYGVRHPMQATSGPMTEALASGGSSNTARKAIAAQCRSTLS